MSRRAIGAGVGLLAALLLVLGAMAIKGQLLTLPAAPRGDPVDGFDAERAVERLARVLGDERPHPVDSAANDAVRERLIGELRALGLNPRVTDDFACNGFARYPAVACARVRNVVATIGPAEGRHLLLAAHYDSTFAGPGAADAGIAVATLMEVAALLRGRELGRPVTFLFNEGEEMGLLGARAFLERDPVAPRVDALLNFEARGVTGPATMFETSRPNAPAIARFARSVDRPVANSLTTDLYRLIPNSTDVAVFDARDWTILNFAIIGNETRYHSAGDDLAALDRPSVQHMGEQGLALTLDFANRPPPDARGERLYTDLLGRQLVTLPMLFGLILLGVLLLFFLVEAWRRRAFGRPLAAVAAALFGAPLAAWAGQLLVGLLRDGDYWRGYPIVTSLAVYASAIAATLLAIAFVARTVETPRLRAAFWLAFLAVGAALAIVTPGGAIYFLLPPLLAALGMALAGRWRWAEPAGAAAALLLLYLSFGPALALFEELMSNGPHWMFAPIGAAMIVPAVIELKPLLARASRAVPAVAAAALFALPWTAAALAPAYSVDRQQLFTIEYVWDADARRGRWAVNNDGRPVPFDAAWERRELPYSVRRRWAAPAPPIAVPAPGVELVSSESLPNGRRVRFRLRTNGAEAVTMLAPARSPLRRAGSGAFIQPFGKGAEDDRYILRCVGRSCDGALFDLEIGRPAQIEFTLVGTRSGLPAAAAPLVNARPALARPQYSPDSTISLATVRL